MQRVSTTDDVGTGEPIPTTICGGVIRLVVRISYAHNTVRAHGGEQNHLHFFSPSLLPGDPIRSKLFITVIPRTSVIHVEIGSHDSRAAARLTVEIGDCGERSYAIGITHPCVRVFGDDLIDRSVVINRAASAVYARRRAACVYGCIFDVRTCARRGVGEMFDLGTS